MSEHAEIWGGVSAMTSSSSFCLPFVYPDPPASARVALSANAMGRWVLLAKKSLEFGVRCKGGLQYHIPPSLQNERLVRAFTQWRGALPCASLLLLHLSFYFGDLVSATPLLIGGNLETRGEPFFFSSLSPIPRKKSDQTLKLCEYDIMITSEKSRTWVKKWGKSLEVRQPLKASAHPPPYPARFWLAGFEWRNERWSAQ